MEGSLTGKSSESPVVFQVPGEPASVITGVPDVTSGAITCNNSDTRYAQVPSDDPCLGKWLEGRKLRKLFRDRYYSGEVVKYDAETKWYRVAYEDGGSEDLEWHDLEELLLPLDISIPLMTLAYDRYKSEKSAAEAKINMRKSTKESMERAVELLQTPQVSEPTEQKVTEANFIYERTQQGILPMQRETQVENMVNNLQVNKQRESVSESGVDVRQNHMKRSLPMQIRIEVDNVENHLQSKHKESVLESGSNMRKNHTKRSRAKTPELLLKHQINESREPMVMEANFNGGRTHKDQMRHNGRPFNRLESESPLVFEVTGEPAIIVNGVPDVTLGATTSNHPGSKYVPVASDDPCLGEWLEGRKIQKLFGDQYYSGKVVKYDAETKWYRVVYEDGDFEDLEWHELEELLLPLDMSIPLITLVLDKCKPAEICA